MRVTHLTVATADDDPEAEVNKDQWNGDHVIEAFGSGTSFPGSPSTDDLYYRTDLGVLCQYDGTRWLGPLLSDILKSDATAYSAASGAFVAFDAVAFSGVRDLWLVSADISFIVLGGTALSASHKWVLVLQSGPSGTTLATYNIDSGASDTFRSLTVVSIGALLGTSQNSYLSYLTKTGTPGVLYFSHRINYRVVYT